MSSLGAPPRGVRPLVPPASAATPSTVLSGVRTSDRSFSSIDNNINNVGMEKKSGPPWDEMRYFVITPDQRTDEAVCGGSDGRRIESRIDLPTQSLAWGLALRLR